MQLNKGNAINCIMEIRKKKKVMQHTKQNKGQKHIVSVDAEKNLDKIQYCFMIKALNKLRRKKCTSS
jgi:CxxC motif-containing protein